MDLRSMLKKTFIALNAEWSVKTGRELLDTLHPTQMIVHLSDPLQAYYLYAVQEARPLLESTAADLPLREALNTQNSPVTPIVDLYSDPWNIPDRCIVQEDERIVGFFDAETPLPLVRRQASPILVRGQPTEETKSELATHRALHAEFPEQVELDALTSLLVSIEAPLEEGNLPLDALPVGATVDIVVQAKRGFILEGPGEGSLIITTDQEALPLQFKLRSATLGSGLIHLLAFHQGVPLGRLTIAPSVIANVSRGKVPIKHEEPLASVSVSQPDITLMVEDKWVDGRREFTLRFSAADPCRGLNLKTFDPIPFQADPGRYFEDFYRDIESYSVATPAERDEAFCNLEGKGRWLFKSLFPEAARQLLWTLKDQISSVLIDSEEPWIPWELCKLFGEENGKIVPGPFFCEAFAITRWIVGLPFQSRLTLQNLAVVVPGDSGLPTAGNEQDYLQGLSRTGRNVTCIPAQPVPLLRALASGTYDGWHFAGHGAYRSTDPNQSVILLENQKLFTPNMLTGEIANLGRTHPFVFLNACQIGRSGMSLTDLGGWGKQFLDAGAGAFIGPYWSISDSSAPIFAKEIYNRLLVGCPFGKAVQEARLALKKTVDPMTWLAYTAFAYPTATVQCGS